MLLCRTGTHRQPEAVYRETEFTPVEQDEVFEKLKKLNERKATGNDGIPPKLITMVASKLSTPLT